MSKTGKCNCQKRVGYAIQTKRLNPKKLEYSALEQTDPEHFKQAMEEMDELSFIFAELPKYHAPQEARTFLDQILSSDSMKIIQAEV